ncbi:MAG TPA: response regulator [Dehalococcoidia bacterium]|nr:response regulator [Dehalococcoidia bacterium]
MTTVLVVDDEFDIRELLVDTLLDAGLNVIEASDGNSALERIATDHPDIVLLDIWMPGMDGLEVLGKLREDPDTVALPVILLTAMPADVGESAGLKMGVTHYVNKPWEPGVVEATLRIALRESGATVTRQFSDANLSADSVCITADLTQQFSSQAAMTKLQSGRRKRPTITNNQGEEVEVITTGAKLPAFEQKMGGGLPVGTVNVAVGAAASGKSVICQHLVWGALEGGYGVAFFSSEFSPEGLATQMASIGLDVTQHMRSNKLNVYPMPEPAEGEEPGPVLFNLSRAIERLSRGAEFIVVDSITDLAGSCPEQAVIAFFSACRRLGNNGRTILVSVHSYAFASEMFQRLRTLCDGYLTLGSEQVRGKSLRILQVNKMNTTELSSNNAVAFVVEAGTGARLVPFNKT